MSFIKKIKRFVGKRSINRQLKKISRTKQTCSLESAKTIGVLFVYNHQKGFKEIKEFLSDMAKQGKQVFALGYIPPNQNFSNADLLANINYFNHKELKWFGKPNLESVEAFMKQEFDMMFTFCSEYLYPIEYVNQLSLSKFKIGFPSYLEFGSDFCLDVENQNDLKYYIEQLMLYLNMIK